MNQFTKKVGVVSSSPAYDEEVSLAQYIAVLWQYRLGLLAIALLAGIVTLVISLTRAPVYQASSKLMVSPSKIGDQAGAAVSVGTYQAMVNSQMLVLQVMKELGLFGPPHNLSVTRFMQQQLQVDVVPDTHVIQVSVRLTDPALAAKFANQLAERAIEASRRVNQEDTVSARDTIKTQLDESRARLTTAEKNLEAYRKEAQLDALRKDVTAMLDERSRLLPLLVDIEAERARIAQTLEELTNQQPVRDVRRSVSPTVVLNPQTGQAERPVTQPNQTGQAGQTAQPDPRNQAGQASQATQELKLRDDVLNPFVNPVYEVLQQQLSASRTKLSALEKQRAEIMRTTDLGQAAALKLRELYTKEAETERLQTELALSKQVYLDVSNRYEQARIQVAGRSPQLQVIDQAVPPETPISPRVVRDTAFATVLAAVVAGGLLLLVSVVRGELRQTR
jgi:polysaccharide biosynthesis transport protein